VHNADLVENYPGFPRGIRGPRLGRLLEQHLAAVGIEALKARVEHLRRRRCGYELITRKGRRVRCEVVILATGSEPRTGLVGEPPELVARGVFYEVADLPAGLAGRRVLIAGGGDAAHDYALNLARRGAEVMLLIRGAPCCLALLADRVGAQPGITVLAPVVISRIAAQGTDGVSVTCDLPSGTRVVSADLLVVACGRRPRDILLRRLDRSGTIDHPPPSTSDLVAGRVQRGAGLFAGGDLIRGGHRQAGIAVGDGLRIAMAAADYLKRQAAGH